MTNVKIFIVCRFRQCPWRYISVFVLFSNHIEIWEKFSDRNLYNQWDRKFSNWFFVCFFHKRNFSADLQIFLLTGVLGGFTTFSAFSLETLQLIEQKECYKAVIYVLGSVFLGVVACFGGYLLAHWGHK